ncbi:hypothetical protein EMIT0194P_90159 [Pseudomonas serbica]
MQAHRNRIRPTGGGGASSGGNGSSLRSNTPSIVVSEMIRVSGFCHLSGVFRVARCHSHSLHWPELRSAPECPDPNTVQRSAWSEMLDAPVEGEARHDDDSWGFSDWATQRMGGDKDLWLSRGWHQWRIRSAEPGQGQD